MTKRKNEIFGELRRLLDTHPSGCPDDPVILEILSTLFNEEEARLACALVFVPRPVEWVSGRAGIPPEEAEHLLESLADRGVVFAREKEGKRGYALLPVMPGIFEFPFMKGEHSELQEKLAALWKVYMPVLSRGFGTPGMRMSRIVPVQEEVESVPGILTYEMIDALIDGARAVGIAHCACRESEGNCDAPREACMVFDDACDFLAERGFARYLTREEMKEKLREFDKAGLVHQVNNSKDRLGLICNCCRCCCMLLRAASEFGNPNVYASSGFVPLVDADSCDGCAVCADERCPVGAVKVVDEIARIDVTTCIGCGLCVTGCQNDALALIRREAVIEPADTTREMGLKMLQDKGKLEEFIKLHST